MALFKALMMLVGGSILLFLPGFAWSYVFFAKKEADLVIRVVLSLGLSVALVPLTVFWLNWLFKVSISLANFIIISLALIVIPLLYLQLKKSMKTKRSRL